MSNSTKKKTQPNATTSPNLQKWLDSSHAKYGQGAAPEVPTGTTREEQDVLGVYQAAAQNAVGIEKRAQNAQLQANKAFDLTQKYLAAQNEANGLTGLGISDTSLLRASSQYQQALADANATREQSLLENYKAAQEDVSTIRGEWASKQEAEHDEKMAEIKENALYNEDAGAVNQYLAANGIEKGSDDYNSIMSSWELQYGESDVKKIAAKTLAERGVQTDDDGNAVNAAFNVNNVNSENDMESLAERILVQEGFINEDGEILYNGDVLDDSTAMTSGRKDDLVNQKKQLTNLLRLSRNWGKDKNGTVVDMVQGYNQENYVFYDGTWYRTNWSHDELRKAGYEVLYVENLQ